jgi:hypothetical protein
MSPTFESGWQPSRRSVLRSLERLFLPLNTLQSLTLRQQPLQCRRVGQPTMFWRSLFT